MSIRVDRIRKEAEECLGRQVFISTSTLIGRHGSEVSGRFLFYVIDDHPDRSMSAVLSPKEAEDVVEPS